MKNYLYIIIIFLSLISCGKKGDPEYKGSNIIQSHRSVV